MPPEFDDPIADAMLSDSPYDRVTAERYRPVRGPVSRTLARQAVLLVALATALPIVATYPESTAVLPDHAVVETFPKVLVLGALGGMTQLAGALALVALVVVRPRIDTERGAHRLVTMEDLATTVSLGTGGMAIVFTDLLLALGHVEEALSLLTRGKTEPMAAVGTDLTVGSVAVLALAGALLCAVASRWVVAYERQRDD
jgi:hypothetical protein